MNIKKFPNDVYIFDYDDFLRKPKALMNDLSSWLNIEFEQSSLETSVLGFVTDKIDSCSSVPPASTSPQSRLEYAHESRFRDSFDAVCELINLFSSAKDVSQKKRGLRRSKAMGILPTDNAESFRARVDVLDHLMETDMTRETVVNFFLRKFTKIESIL